MDLYFKKKLIKSYKCYNTDVHNLTMKMVLEIYFSTTTDYVFNIKLISAFIFFPMFIYLKNELIDF